MSSYPLAKPSAHLDRRTKIIATVGPASWDIGVLEQLIAAGADVFRLNFSHAGPDKQAQTIETIRKAADTLGRAGGDPRRPARAEAPHRQPPRRLRRARDRHARHPHRRARSRATARRSRSPGRASPACRRTSSSTSPTGRSACGSATGDGDGVDAEVEVGGTLSSHKGMNIPGGAELPAATESRPRLGRLRGQGGHRPDRRLLRLLGRRPAAGQRAPAQPRLRHPADREDRARSRPPSTSRRSSRRRPAASWSPAATSASKCRWPRCRSCRSA